jgi:hypothetical protein
MLVAEVSAAKTPVEVVDSGADSDGASEAAMTQQDTKIKREERREGRRERSEYDERHTKYDVGGQ